MSHALRVLIIEDDPIVAKTIERCLRKESFHIQHVETGEAGFDLAVREPPDLILLDVLLPGIDGYEVCRMARQEPSLARVPILFLSGRNYPDDRIAGFQAGGDDYIVKPFNVEELLLRIRAILYRTQRQKIAVSGEGESAWFLRSYRHPAQADRVLRIGAYALNTRTFEFSSPYTENHRLTPIQFELLQYLMEHAGEILSTARLLDEVWKYPPESGSADLVRVHIKKLREAIEPDPRNPRLIHTVPGFGYTVVVKDETPPPD